MANKVISFLSFFILVQTSFAQIMYPGEGEVISSKETVFDWSADACAPKNSMDGAAHFFRDALNNIQMIVPSDEQWRFTGADFDNLVPDCDNGAVHTSDEDSLEAKFNYKEWIMAPYTEDGITIHTLVHNEFHGYDFNDKCGHADVLKCWYNGITSTSSSDTGKSYTHATAPNHLVAATPYVYDKDHGYRQGAFSPSNIIKHQTDGYFYAFFHTESKDLQTDGLVIMRTNDLSDASSWRMYDGAGFNTVSVNPYTDTYNVEDHLFHNINGTKSVGRVVWSTYFERYLMVFDSKMEIDAHGGMTEGVYYALSEDLINWSAKKLLYRYNFIVGSEVNDATLDYAAYPSIIDHEDTTRNFEEIGREAYLYYTKWTDKNNSGSPDRDLIRVKVRFHKNMVSGFIVNGAGNQEDTNPGDGVCETPSGNCSFYAAIQESNGRMEKYADTILTVDFNISTATINATAGAGSIPASNYPLYIDGFSQSGSVPNTAAINEEINAVYGVRINLGDRPGLTFKGGNTTVKGLVISNGQAATVTFSEKGNNVIKGCFIGTSLDGSENQSETYDGQGILVDGVANVVIGGENPEDRNLIIGGVKIKGEQAINTEIKGNYIGVDYTGKQALEQSEHGVDFSNGANNIYLGGEVLGARNVISGNNRGVNMEASCNNIQIINNYIGINNSGDAGLSNSSAALSIEGDNNSIKGNIIGGNSGGEALIWLSGNSNVIKSNYLGTESTFTYDFTQNATPGIILFDGAENNTIGALGEGNVITNTTDGIAFFGNAGTGNIISANSIFNNSSFGIDHGADDMAAEEDIPDFSLTAKMGDSLLVTGTFSGSPNVNYTLEIFVNSGCSSSGYGEGKSYIGETEITSDNNGDLVFSGQFLAVSVSEGDVITATITGEGGNTSEFSECSAVELGVPDIRLSEENYVFNVPTNASDNQSFTIYNDGTANLNWTASNQNNWMSSDETGGTIEGGGSTTFNLNVFTNGMSTGVYYDTLNIISNDPYSANSKVYIVLNVVAAKIAGYPTDTTFISIEPNFVEPKSFWVKNTGNEALTFTAGKNMGGMLIANLNPTNGSVNPGDSIQINFNINSNGKNIDTYNEFIWISSNDPDNNVVEIHFEITVDIFTSAQLLESNELLVYANEGDLMIDNTTSKEAIQQILIQTIDGKIVHKISKPSQGKHAVILSSKGIYVVSFYTEEGVLTKKVIVN